MRVVFDISQAAAAVRTGVFRVLENVAIELEKSPETELKFSAYAFWQGPKACARFLRDHPQLSDVPLLNARHNEARHSMNRRIERINSTVPPLSHLSSEVKARDWSGLRHDAQVSKRLTRQILTLSENFLSLKGQPLSMRALCRADIFHSSFFAIPPIVRQRSRAQKFLTIYDMIPDIYPQFFEEGPRYVIRQILQTIQPDDWMCAISQSTKNDFCERVNINPQRVFVTPLAASREVFYPCTEPAQIELARAKYQIPDGPYLLSLCTLEPRKNIDHAIKCFARLVHEQNAPGFESGSGRR